MRKLKIAVWHNLPSGGGKRQLYTHLKGLIDRGHTVESWCPDTADQDFLPLNTLITEHVIPLKKRFSLVSSRQIFSYLRYSYTSMNAHAKECANQINRGNFDLLLAGSCTLFRAPAIGRYVTIPSAVYLGEPNRILYEALPELPWIAPPPSVVTMPISFRSIKVNIRQYIEHGAIRFLARQELEDIKGFDRVLVNSLFSRENILRTYNIESKVCYLGIDQQYYMPTGENKEDFIVGVGSFHSIKGIDRAIRAMSLIKRSKRPPLIWVGNAGSDYEISILVKLAKKVGVEFILKINIPGKEVISLLSRARAMIYTSRLEPFGLAPLEANACGTAVVAIAEGGVRETIKDGINGFLVSEDDPEKLGCLLTRFIDDCELSYSMGKRAREYVGENWSMKMCIDTIENQLYDLLEKVKT